MSADEARWERAHAKVNLGLSVLARRGDGFHEIETLMARISLHDEIRLEPTDGGVELTVEGAELPTDDGNLAVRAARAYLASAGSDAGVRLHLRKRIPIAAGLGGGSSDAAAVLRGLDAAIGADVDLAALAKALGSDVPFFLADVPAALARGRGERLEPVDLPPLDLVVLSPPEPVSAAEAYAALQSFTPRLKLGPLLERLRRGEEPGLVNALQPGVVRAHPVVREAIRALRDAGLRGAGMSGSGSSCFGLATDAAEAERIAARLEAAYPAWSAVAVRSV